MTSASPATPSTTAGEESLRAGVDVMIPTWNERSNIAHSIGSVIGWANKVFVLDSGSTDGTQQLARDLGAIVVEHPWEGYARQKNWGLENLPFESEWVFILDADEAITPELRDEIVKIASVPADEIAESGFYVNRYLIFLGKRIRHCGYFPSWNLRFFRRGAARYEDRPVHEHMILTGKEGYLKGLMSHEDHRGLEYYIAKHNRYSTLEAETAFAAGRNGRHDALKPAFFGNAVQRRRFLLLKVLPKIPFRSLARFIWMYFIKRGILDGAVGFRFCLFIAIHGFFTDLKLREMRLEARRPGGAPLPDTTREQLRTDLIDNRRTDQPAPTPTVPSPPPEAAPATVHRTEGAGIEAIMQERSRSPWSLGQKVSRVLWMFVWSTLFRCSFHNWYGWRRWLLRCFGARIGKEVKIRPTVWIEIPWNVEMGDYSVVGDDAILYSLGKITIGRGAVVSQYAHLCTGTHDHTLRTFPLVCTPIHIGEEAWIAADAFIGPGVTVGDRSIIGARATVVRDIPADQVAVGNPARPIHARPAFR